MHQCPAVQLQHLVKRNCVSFIVKVVGVAQNVTDGVTNLTIYLRQLLQNLGGNADICLVIRGSGPQADDISAILLNYVLRNDDVAYRLRHLAAIAVNYVAMGQYSFIGSAALNGNRGEQRGLEPAAVLVAAL